MFWRTVSSLGLVAIALSIPVPQQPYLGGFQPLQGARGPSGPDAGYNARAPANTFSGGQASAGPTKTIYVNVPPAPAAAPLPPIASGPPRQHYKIVFIRAPTPPPVAQPILPPRTEQKTLIYVLHQRPQAQQQEVIEVPTIKHSPEVYFVQYDNPPTAEELQQLTAGDLSGLPYSPPGLTGLDQSSLRSLPEAGAGENNLITQLDQAILGEFPNNTPISFDPRPRAPAPAAPVFIVDPAFSASAAPSVGVPISATDGGFGGAPIGGVSLQDAGAFFSDPLPAILAPAAEPAAPIFTPLTVAPESVGVPLTETVGFAPSGPQVGVSLSRSIGSGPPTGRVGVPLEETITSGGSTIAAGVGGAVAPETFSFGPGDAFGLRTIQRR